MKLSVIALGAIVLAPVADAAQTRRQNCPSVHIFGARETTAPPGFGSASTVVNLIQRANNGATSEPIIYPAAGGNAYAASGVSLQNSLPSSGANNCYSLLPVLLDSSVGLLKASFKRTATRKIRSVRMGTVRPRTRATGESTARKH